MTSHKPARLWMLRGTRPGCRHGLLLLGLLSVGCGAGVSTDPLPLVADLSCDDVQIGGVVFSPDGKTLIAGGLQSEVVLWEVETWKVRRRWKGPGPWAVGSVAVSPDGRLVAASYIRQIIVTSLPTGKDRHWWDEAFMPCALTFSPDGKVLASASDETVELWDPRTGEALASLRPSSDPWAPAFSPDGKLLAVGGGKLSLPCYGRVEVWEVSSRKRMLQLGGHPVAVRDVAFSPDGSALASVSTSTIDKPQVRIEDPKTGKLLAHWEPHLESPSLLAFSPSGNVLAVGGGRTAGPGGLWGWESGWGTVLFLEYPSGKPLHKFKAAPEDAIHSLAFSPDGKLLAVANGEKSVKVWDVSAITGGGPAPPARVKPAGEGLPLREASAEELEGWWSDLGSANGERAYDAIWSLALARGQAVPFLAERLRPAAGPDADPTRRELRAVEALEHAGSPGAVRLLKELVAGAPEARLTREAKASLRRLGEAAPERGP